MAKKLYTSYYAKASKIPPNHVQVAISISVPNWWMPSSRVVEKLLAPSKGFNEPGWKRRYVDKMEKMAASGKLQKIVDGLPDGAVLLCFEKDPDDCHRKIALDYMIRECGVEGEEFMTEEEQGLFGPL